MLDTINWITGIPINFGFRFAVKGSLTIGNAGVALPLHYYHFCTKKSSANARTNVRETLQMLGNMRQV